MRKFLILFVGVILGHFLVTYGLLIFHAYEEIRVIGGEVVHVTPAGAIASNVAKILSQPLISIQAIHPDPKDAVQTFSFMLGNSAIWATVISMVSACRIKQLTNR
tara:strand:+ start:134 stop:448 length:315 start_codon:yes stop_codon:yes gene_type:complete